MNVSRRVRVFLLGGLTILLVTELGSFVAIELANRVLDEPILTRRKIYEYQTTGLQSLIARDTARGRDRLDSTLGWIYAPGWNSDGDRINFQGIRALREFTRTPSDTVVRIAAFGDSFVYDTEVSTDKAWTSRFNEYAVGVEILNYGVGGYGTDQSLLRYRREGMDLCPDAVIIGFAPVNVRRTVNVYRRFISVRTGLLTKPRFQLVDGESKLIPNPIRDRSAWARFIENPAAIKELGRYDQWYESLVYENPLYDWSASVRLVVNLWIRVKRRWLDPDRIVDRGVLNTSSEAYRIQLALLKRFVAEVTESGRTPVVLMLPDRDVVSAALDGRPPVYASLTNALTRSGVNVLDAADAFTDAFTKVGTRIGVSSLFMPGGHYSAAGTELLATWLIKELLPLVRIVGSRRQDC